MIHAQLNERRAVPWWAAIGAPLLGVPLMVALLSLASPKTSAEAGEAGAVIETEQVQGPSVDQTQGRRPDEYLPRSLKSC